ncbi:MAG: ribonuclease P [Methanomicrobiales archaeon]|nr:ribonuclease P [Methanomicrobiales archaeon]
MRSQNQTGKKIARERIEILLLRARDLYHTEPEQSRRCVAIARKISTRQRVRIPRELRRLFCRKCSGILIPGHSGRVRLHHGKITTTCLACGKQKRIPVVRTHRK